MSQATMTEREFCEAVNISRRLAWLMRKEGKLPHIRLGRKVLYTPRHVEEFLARFEQNRLGSEGGN